ncbi:MAG: exo-alpha-sialidase, partial [Lentisphaeria bacterium]|nr:exo-alpha-sialidase [Lentisphaeria bacterium]
TYFRFPVWSVRSAAGEWSPVRRKLVVPGMENAPSYSCGSSQWFFRGRNQVYIPLTYGEPGRRDRMVCSTRFSYDGKELVFEERGNTLELPVDRGLLEPSIAEFGGRVLMTIRAEDGRGYRSESADGLHWEPAKPWAFDDGEELKMSTTQQHFLVCGGKLHLVYTRDAGNNAHVTRFRAPLFIAEIDDRLELIRESEETVFPLLDEGEHGAGMGNFQAVPVAEDEAFVTVGEERWYDDYRGNTLLARITF